MIEEEVQDPEVPSTQSCTLVDGRRGRRGRRGGAARVDDGGARLATVGMKSFSTQARSARMSVIGAPLTVGLGQVGVLGGGVVAPDGDLVDVGDVAAGLGRQLGQGGGCGPDGSWP